jgi:uncharacterized membrane protein
VVAAALAVVALWVGFAASHMALSSLRWRPALVARLGERGFAGAYSLVAFAFFVPLVWVYLANRHAGPLLWSVERGPLLTWVLYVLMGVAWVLAVAGLVQPSPASLTGRDTLVRGVHRLTRHPLFMGVGLFGALHCVFMGFASDVAFFAGFPVFAVLGCAHQDRRKLVTAGEAYRAWHAQTPFLPFTGRDTLRGLRELPPAAVLGGVALSFLLRWLHGPLFR